MLFPALLLTLAQAAPPQGVAPRAAPATPKPEPTGPVVELVTSLGSIKIALDAEKAPITVENYLNSATSQFFINVKDNHRLDFGIGGAGYAVFGAVVEGMDVVDRIVGVPTTTKTASGTAYENVPVTPVLIKTAREVKAAAKPAAPKP